MLGHRLLPLIRIGRMIYFFLENRGSSSQAHSPDNWTMRAKLCLSCWRQWPDTQASYSPLHRFLFCSSSPESFIHPIFVHLCRPKLQDSSSQWNEVLKQIPYPVKQQCLKAAVICFYFFCHCQFCQTWILCDWKSSVQWHSNLSFGGGGLNVHCRDASSSCVS